MCLGILERCGAFLLRVLGNSAGHRDPLLSEAIKSSMEFEPEGGNFDEAVGQGDHMDDILSTTEYMYMGMEEDPVDLTISINNVDSSLCCLRMS